MAAIFALALLWVILKLATGGVPPPRRNAPARELYERRLRDGGNR